MAGSMSFHLRQRPLLAVSILAYLVVACVASGPQDGAVPQNGWWQGNGPVIPHESFPTDCALCHIGEKWQALSAGFHYDHLAETGVPLEGSHARARCLRCHNDRGPVTDFSSKGCAGCHEDVHFGLLGPDCTDCHQQLTWEPVGMILRHEETRFPLRGVHASVSCRRCHPGAEVGIFVPTDTECLTCHRADLARANNPNHVALGWINECDRCHRPTNWNQAIIQ
jgi:hypothetical protein